MKVTISSKKKEYLFIQPQNDGIGRITMKLTISVPNRLKFQVKEARTVVSSEKWYT